MCPCVMTQIRATEMNRSSINIQLKIKRLVEKNLKKKYETKNKDTVIVGRLNVARRSFGFFKLMFIVC